MKKELPLFRVSSKDASSAFCDPKTSYEAPRATMIKEDTLTEDFIRDIIKAGTTTAQGDDIEHIFIPQHEKHAIFLGTGSHSNVNCIDPYDKNKMVPVMTSPTLQRLFPNFIGTNYMRPDEVLKQQAREVSEHLMSLEQNSSWVAHMHPFDPNTPKVAPSATDIRIAIDDEKLSFVFGENGTVVYFSPKHHTPEEKKAIKHNLGSALQEMEEVKAVSPITALQNDFILNQFPSEDFICIQVPWGTPEMQTVIDTMSGKRSASETKTFFINTTQHTRTQ